MRNYHGDWRTICAVVDMMSYIPEICRRGTEPEIVRYNSVSLHEQRIVVTKDTNFVTSFVLHGRPHKLLLVSTGNIGNDELVDLFTKHIEMIETALMTYSSVEINRTGMITHA